MLTERQVTVLRAIIRLFTETGQPVGSKTLMASLPIKVSSATIRNDMAHLEKEQLITKTHSSSGRVPTIAGYRYYLDHLIKPTASPVDVATIKRLFDGNYHKLDEIVAQSANVLSNLTNYTTIALGPSAVKTHLSGFRLVPLDDHQVMAIIVTDAGTIENQIFTLSPDIKGDMIEKVIRVINDQLVGLPIAEINRELSTGKIKQMFMKYLASPQGFVDIFDEVLTRLAHQHYYVGGRMNLLNYADDQTDLHQLQSLYDVIDHDQGLTTLLKDDQVDPDEHDIHVHLGTEMTSDMWNNYSLITASYDVGKHGRGMVALLGPTKMPYSRIIGLLDVFRSELVKRLNDYYIHLD